MITSVSVNKHKQVFVSVLSTSTFFCFYSKILWWIFVEVNFSAYAHVDHTIPTLRRTTEGVRRVKGVARPRVTAATCVTPHDPSRPLHSTEDTRSHNRTRIPFLPNTFYIYYKTYVRLRSARLPRKFRISNFVFFILFV